MEEEVASVVAVEAVDDKDGANLGCKPNGIAPRMTVKSHAVLVNCAEPQAGNNLGACVDPG